MNPILLRIVFALVLVVVGFGTGWQVKGAFIAERDLALVEAKVELLRTYREAEAGKAKILETKLQALRANERTIEHEKLKIIDRPVYLNQCLDADGLRLIERARTGSADSAEPPSEVPRVK